MIGPDLSRVGVYVRPGATDMRKAINGLSIIVAEQMERDPLCGALYVFCNRERRIGILSILVDGHPFGLRPYAADSSTSSPFLKTRPSRTSSSCCQRVSFRQPLRASMMSR